MRKLLLLMLLSFLMAPVSVFADVAEELRELSLYYGEEDLIMSSSRSPHPAPTVAENVTVITADDMERMNAHTVLDVLSRVAGLTVMARGGAETAGPILIRGADMRDVRVVLDGLTLNLQAESLSPLHQIPVQMIERVEIIRETASSSWGGGPGGLINIITKQPPQ